MTECERIIKNGILPESFFKPETICDFYVDEGRKKLWAILIDLLVKFDDVCRRHNLKYWISFGGLLGIVRHKGFIPWDDDLDVCMPREDYEILMSLKEEFLNPYYLQIPLVDDGYFYSFAKLRNSNTTAISNVLVYQNFNQGCFLDIFPLDNCLKEDMVENASAIKELLILNSTSMKRSNPNLSNSDKQRLIDYPYQDPKLVFEKMEKMARMHNNEESEFCSPAVMTIYPPEKMCWRKSDISPVREASFYGHNVYIPQNPHNVLSQTYNNYMEFPPIEKRGTWHSGAYFGADVPYQQLLRKFRQKMQ